MKSHFTYASRSSIFNAFSNKRRRKKRRKEIERERERIINKKNKLYDIKRREKKKEKIGNNARMFDYPREE